MGRASEDNWLLDAVFVRLVLHMTKNDFTWAHKMAIVIFFRGHCVWCNKSIAISVPWKYTYKIYVIKVAIFKSAAAQISFIISSSIYSQTMLVSIQTHNGRKRTLSYFWKIAKSNRSCFTSLNGFANPLRTPLQLRTFKSN